MIAAAAGRLGELLSGLSPAAKGGSAGASDGELAVVQYVLGGLRLQQSELATVLPSGSMHKSTVDGKNNENNDGGAHGGPENRSEGHRGVVLPPAAAEAAALARQGVAHLRAAIRLDPNHADAKYYLSLQLMKRPGSVADAAALLGSIDCSKHSKHPVQDFSEIDVLLLAGQAEEKSGNLRGAAGAFRQATKLWEQLAKRRASDAIDGSREQLFKFGLAYYNLARMLDLQLQAEIRRQRSRTQGVGPIEFEDPDVSPDGVDRVAVTGQQHFPAVWHLTDMRAIAAYRKSLLRGSASAYISASRTSAALRAAAAVYQDSAERMKGWRPEWRQMPERVFGSTMAWLRIAAAFEDVAAAVSTADTNDHRECDENRSSAIAGNVGSESDGGGWAEQQSVEAEALASEVHCTIDRRIASELTISDFIAEYADKNKPVLITGPSAIPSSWPAWTKWTRQGLLDHYGNTTVQLRRSSVIATDAEFGSAEAYDYNITVADFLNGPHFSEKGSESNDFEEDKVFATADPPYLFAQNPLSGLEKDYTSPKWFDASAGDNRFGFSWQEQQKTALFFVGPSLSGVNFHQHTAAWNALLYGQKRWFLFPPYSIYGPTSLPMGEWYRKYYAELRENSVVLECVQEAGELLFVPTNWYHGTLNTKPSVGIAVEIGQNMQLFERSRMLG
eukprot:SAG31_NODE_875_length_11316_cov_8.924044_11_plen_673_part_00